MPKSLTWLPQVLLDAGLKVSLCPGWEDRGHGDMGQISGILCHHTATPGKQGNIPTLNTLIKGRSDLPGPLSQLGLGRDGTYYIIAAGKCFHAGKGMWNNVVNGNSNFIGIEAENTGRHDDFPWPEIQMEAYHLGVAAILKHIGKDHTWCAGHKEYALPRGRKSDPDFDMVSFRSAVKDILNGTGKPARVIPVAETGELVKAARPTLRRGANNDIDLVKQIQQKLHLNPDGDFGPKTEAAIRKVQAEHNMVADGIVGPKSWALFDKV
ncbi:MAG: N-acetylmuramoyl-L-alanine amidase [Sphingobacteriaceae bacterium]|nr:MAG: N-acetylmuramoyl-L-alanine amidase [Sphingobacteriaceae bacterium]